MPIKRRKIPVYENSQIKALICERVHDAAHRNILYQYYVNEPSQERLAEKFHMSAKQIGRIIRKYDWALFHDFPG